MNFKLLSITTLAMVALNACQSGYGNKDQQELPHFTASDMDLTVDPGVNFYQYANGGWRAANPLPDDKSRFGTFDRLAEENKERVKLIIETAASQKAAKGSVAQKIGDYYGAGMDTLRINELGYQPIETMLSAIASINSKESLTSVLSDLHVKQLSPLFYVYSTPDKKNSNMTIAGIYQGGLGMPDRDYYFEEGEQSEELRKAYIDFLTTLFTLKGHDEMQATDLAMEVMTFETELARASNTKEENRDPLKTYNKVDADGLATMAPQFPWNEFITALGISVPAEINVSQPAFIAKVAELFENKPLNEWQSYLEALVLRKMADNLSDDFVEAHFAFYGKALSGQKEMEPRWKRIIDNTNGALGEAVGQLFVAEYFPPAAKERMDVLVENLRKGFAKRIDNLEWMSDETKVKAHEKLAAIRVKIGYPSKWRDYSALEVSADDYVGNILASNAFEFTYDMAKIGKPVDKEEWFMNPQTVNAYYNPSANEIVFPAAILQPPFFYLNGDDAVNYGAIGVVIGHEMTHGFDDKGRLYAKDGNLMEWWTEEDSEKFNARSQILVDQFNAIEVLPGTFANGKLSLGENIADLGGLVIAYEAYQMALAGKQVQEKLDGFTDKQRFFLAYSRVWAQNIRDKEILRRTKVDVHSLGEHRVNGPLPNIQEWYDAFNISSEHKLFIAPENRASIW